MGLCASKKKVYAFEVNPSKVGHEQGTYDLCHIFLELDDQGVDKFYQLFKKIDKNDSDTFTIDDFYKYVKVDRTNFTDRCFSFIAQPVHSRSPPADCMGLGSLSHTPWASTQPRARTRAVRCLSGWRCILSVGACLSSSYFS